METSTRLEFFYFKSLMAIKMLGKTVIVDQGDKQIQLLNVEDIQAYVYKYKYIRI